MYHVRAWSLFLVQARSRGCPLRSFCAEGAEPSAMYLTCGPFLRAATSPGYRVAPSQDRGVGRQKQAALIRLSPAPPGAWLPFCLSLLWPEHHAFATSVLPSASGTEPLASFLPCPLLTESSMFPSTGIGSIGSTGCPNRLCTHPGPSFPVNYVARRSRPGTSCSSHPLADASLERA